MGDYDDSGSDDYSNHYDDGESDGGGQEHYVQRRKKNPFDLVGAASGDGDCCAHVVSPYVFLLALVGLAIATYFLRMAITTKLGKRRKRASSVFSLETSVQILFAGINHLETGLAWRVFSTSR